jgi:PAS domain S-box-containing protein
LDFNLLKKIPIGILVLDVNNNIIFNNENSEKYIFYIKSDNSFVDKVLQNQDDEKYININGYYCKISTEKIPNYTIIYIEDISKIQNRDDILNQILNNSGNIIFFKDIEGRYLLINKEYEKTFSVTNKDIIGKKDKDIFDNKTYKQLVKNDKRVIFEKDNIAIEEVIWYKDKKYTFIVVKFPIFSPNNNIISIGGIATDIGEKISIEEELKTLTKKLKEKNKELENFASVASHDLKEPIRNISSFAQLLEKRINSELDDKSKRYFNHIIEGCQYATNMINALLEYSKLGNELKYSKESLKDIINDSLKFLDINFEKVKIEYNVKDYIYCDRIQLGRVFQNLIINSIKYKKEDSVLIIINSNIKENYIHISIRDNGLGIEKENINKVFEVFKKLDNRSNGYGIGLSVCKKIIERHNGKIWIESEKDKGTIVNIMLPIGTINE